MMRVRKKLDVRNCLFRLLVTSSGLCPVRIYRWCLSKKKISSYDAIQLLSENTETGNDDCQGQAKVLSGILHKILINNTTPNNASKTWFPVATHRNENELMALEKLRDKDGHES